MRPGVQAQDSVAGTGDEAVRGKVAVVTVRMSLPDGTELPEDFMPRSRILIDLRKRDCMAGLRYGIEGMRVGGRRELRIQPHLAYGAQGVPGKVPPNSPLRCEVELLEVREPGVVKPEDYPPGRQLIVGWLGDLAHGIAKWQFGLHEYGRYGGLVWVPIAGLKWRHARPKMLEKKMVPAQAASLIDSAIALPSRHPADCLTNDQVCVDHSGHDGGVHRNRTTNTLCYAVTVLDGGQTVRQYYLAEDSQAWMTWEIRAIVHGLLDAKGSA
jgi:hypothetical protein